jgi:hypothetical protein
MISPFGDDLEKEILLQIAGGSGIFLVGAMLHDETLWKQWCAFMCQ